MHVHRHRGVRFVHTRFAEQVQHPASRNTEADTHLRANNRTSEYKYEGDSCTGRILRGKSPMVIPCSIHWNSAERVESTTKSANTSGNENSGIVLSPLRGALFREPGLKARNVRVYLGLVKQIPGPLIISPAQLSGQLPRSLR